MHVKYQNQEKKEFEMDRRQFGLTVASAIAAGPALSQTATPMLQVTKTPTCGCCGAWVDEMISAGFKASVEDVDYDTLQVLKQKYGIAPELAGCHTTSVSGYFVEGHVPASDIARLLQEKPAARGVTAPGMPMGSPGMGTRGDPYDVMLVLMDGSTRVFATHG